jgi:hypothetical protein
MKHLHLQIVFLMNLESFHPVYFSKFLIELHQFQKISKINDFTKLRLGVKPPLKMSMFSHIVKFLKSGIWRRGVTLVPKYNMQP